MRRRKRVEGIIARIPKKDDMYCSYTFVRTNNGDYFLHKSEDTNVWREIVNKIDNGLKLKVEFTPAEGTRGPRATRVKIIEVL